MNSLMNNTKWNEIRLAMYNLNKNIKWRTKDIENGYVSNWDGEWFYHFADGGYESIEWLEIKMSEDSKEDILREIKKIHVPAEVINNYLRIYGYKNGFIDYL